MDAKTLSVEQILGKIGSGHAFCMSVGLSVLTHDGRGHLVLNMPDDSQVSITHAITRPDLSELVVRQFVERSI